MFKEGTMGKPFRILSIDGGGIRGVLSVQLLKRLSQTPGLEGWLDHVDMIAGTSTGGLIALGLGKGLSLDELLEMYVKSGPAIFYTSLGERLVERYDPTHALDKIVNADYDTAPLEKVLVNQLGHVTLGQLTKRVVVATFDLDSGDESSLKHDYPNEQERNTIAPQVERFRRWKPKIFHNIPGTDSDATALAYKVGLYTAAAPTYFPTVDGYIDGGVFASNPAMVALAQTRDHRNDPAFRPPLEDVVLFSLGTGLSLQHIPGQNLDWGYLQWAVPLVSIMLEGTSGIADYQCRQLLGDAYQRLAPTFAPGVNIGMDAVDKVPEMIEFVNAIADDKPDPEDQTATANAAAYQNAVRFLKTHWMAGS
jgi:uncharacterized protein